LLRDLSEYVRLLAPDGEPPDLATYAEARELLRAELRRALQRRGLWNLPPRCLGVQGPYWTSDLLEDLVSDCYCEIFLMPRLGALKNRQLTTPDINPLIRRCLTNRVHDRQKGHDPLGATLFKLLRKGLDRLRSAGRLRTSGPREERIANDTVFLFPGQSLWSADPDRDLLPSVRAWNNELWPRLITARGPGRTQVRRRLESLIAELPREGVLAFRFKSLISAMRTVMRDCWQEELSELTELAGSIGGAESDLDYRQLRACVLGLIAKEHRTSADDLRTVWRFLWLYGLGLEAGGTDRAPSGKLMEIELGISRYRIGQAKVILAKLIGRCRSALTRDADRPRAEATAVGRREEAEP
jgi:hypothetical protein